MLDEGCGMHARAGISEGAVGHVQGVPADLFSPGDVADLYARDRLTLVRLAVLLVDDVGAAEDVVQDAFAQLVRRASGLRDPGSAHAYLRTAVVNGCRSALRRRRTARAYVAPAPVVPDSPEASAVLAEAHREVLAALGTLAPRQREVLVLRYWSGLSEAEIAATLGISRGAVKSTASRALDVLQEKLEAQR
jgi:RNA polymerase sigma-70 factor (sigma-E family)